MLKALELFCGVGGSALGVSEAGFNVLEVVDFDPVACSVVILNQVSRRRRLRTTKVTIADVSAVNFSAYRDGIDLLSAGPPCQPFSFGGLHRSHRDGRDGFPSLIRAIAEVRPRAFLIENVGGLARRRFASYLEFVRLQLQFPEVRQKPTESKVEYQKRLRSYAQRGKKAGLKYNVSQATIINAADYGVPQNRKRLFIVGFRGDQSVIWRFPAPTHSQDALNWSKWRQQSYWKRHGVDPPGKRKSREGKSESAHIESRPSRRPWVTIRDAIGDLLDPHGHQSSVANGERISGARRYKGHTGSDLDHVAKAIKAGVHGVGGGENTLRLSNGSVRYFTIRECARLQTFPDDYVFFGNRSRIVRQLGNAVPPKLAKILAQAIANHLRRNRPH